MKRLMVAVVVLAGVVAGLTAAEKTLAVSFSAVQELLTARCAACHDWTGTAEGIADLVKPARPGSEPHLAEGVGGSHAARWAAGGR